MYKDYALMFVNLPIDKHDKALKTTNVKEGGANLTLFENVLELCSKKNISIARLEKEVGLGNATVRGWTKSTPSIRTLKAVADYFGVPVEALLAEKERNP